MATIGSNAGALEAMITHHAALAEGVAQRVATLRTTIEGHDRFGTALAELVEYLANEVLPHATAEERTLYQAARAKDNIAETVASMIEEHRRLASLAERLATSGEKSSLVADAEAIGTLFAAHVDKENELILPALAADEAVDLGKLLAHMHQLTETGQSQPSEAQTEAASDIERALLRLLLDAAKQLAAAEEGDAACKLAAEAWAAVRVGRPDLAVRVTAAMHALVRSVTAEPVTLSKGPLVPKPQTANAADGAVLDVRALAPAQRHEKIFATYNALGSNTAFVLVNDHDPKPLRYQFEAEHLGHFTWEVLEAGPKVWRVRIGRPAASTVGGDESGAQVDIERELDVRCYPHGQRHDVIFTSFDALGEGAGFVLVNDHDPKPLRYQFDVQYTGAYSWEYLEAGPKVWRVRIGRP